MLLPSIYSLPSHNTITVSCHFCLSTCLEKGAVTVLLTGASPVSEDPSTVPASDRCFLHSDA